MLGPLNVYRDEADAERMLDAIRQAGICVTPDTAHPRAFWFRRRFGLLHGTLWRDPQGLYLGYGHPNNPFLWPADSRLLTEVENILQAGGSRRLWDLSPAGKQGRLCRPFESRE